MDSLSATGSQVTVTISNQGNALPLNPGESLTLTIGDSYYWPDLSNFDTPLPSGSSVYAQVDLANAQTTYGGVLESHEISGGTYNNISGPVLSLAGGVAQALPASGSRSPAISSSLPPRD